MGDDLDHRRSGLVEPPGACERLDEPERAGDERALHPLLPAVAVEEPAAGAELALHGVDHGREPPAGDVEVVHPREAQDARVQTAATREHHVAPPLLRPAFRLDELAHLARAVAPRVRALAR